MINLVTAVSRPENLLRIARSISASLSKSKFSAKWILVVDDPNVIHQRSMGHFKNLPFEVKILFHTGGKCQYGIDQKNTGIASISDGYYHCMDDDNIVHQDFFSGLERAMLANPNKRAFVFGQQRWDNIKSLIAAPDRMEYGKIDNTMFVVHSSLIGAHRYDLTRSGREDFHFFRKLYDLYREEFVFISETLSYYNYIKHFPAETKEESASPEIEEKRKSTTSYVVSEPQKSDRTMKIALYSSKRERCGISTYTSHLEEALMLLGHDVRYWSSQPPYDPTFSEIRSWKPDVFHVQHETSIMPPTGVLERYGGLMVKEGVRVMVTLHTENDGTIQMARETTSGISRSIILHRPTPSATDAVVVPMPCTSIGAVDSRESLRKRFGFPENAFVLSTVGFMIPWKDHPRIVDLLLPWIEGKSEVYLQIIASEHFNESMRGYAKDCRDRISRIASRFKDVRIQHVDNYPSDRELIERLAASDLGYVWCPFDTGSSSAAAAQFTTARCPLVASDSSHYAFLGTGIVRGSMKDVESFSKLIQKTSEDKDLLKKLRENQWVMYRERNYIATAMKHLELYKRGAS